MLSFFFNCVFLAFWEILWGIVNEIYLNFHIMFWTSHLNYIFSKGIPLLSSRALHTEALYRVAWVLIDNAALLIEHLRRKCCSAPWHPFPFAVSQCGSVFILVSQPHYVCVSLWVVWMVITGKTRRDDNRQSGLGLFKCSQAEPLCGTVWRPQVPDKLLRGRCRWLWRWLWHQRVEVAATTMKS